MIPKSVILAATEPLIWTLPSGAADMDTGMVMVLVTTWGLHLVWTLFKKRGVSCNW